MNALIVSVRGIQNHCAVFIQLGAWQQNLTELLPLWMKEAISLSFNLKNVDPPIEFNSKIQEIQADIYPALTRMNTFEQAGNVFSQGCDNYIDENCDLVVAHFWCLQDQHQ